MSAGFDKLIVCTDRGDGPFNRSIFQCNYLNIASRFVAITLDTGGNEILLYSCSRTPNCRRLNG